MSWFKDMLPRNGEEGPPPRRKGEVFCGDWQEASKLSPGLTDGIEALMNFALNAPTEEKSGRKGVRMIGDKLVFQIKQMEVGTTKDPDEEGTPIGDYEIEIRRVR